MIFVGTAGWSYPDWEGVVYPTRRPRGFHPLGYLSQYMDFVEVNSTFYALPSAAMVAKWVGVVAERPGFLFFAKLHRDFTHEEWPAYSTGSASAFAEGIAPLREARRLAGILVQFPVTFRRAPPALDRLKRIRDLFPRESLVVELRHRTWFEPEGIAELEPLGVSLAHVDMPESRDHPPESHQTLGPIGYLRLHGRNREEWFRRGAGRDDRYDYLYGPGEVAEVVTRARRIEAERSSTYLVTNNHFRGKAVANAIEIRSLLAGTPVPAPVPLLATYPHLADVSVASGQLRMF